MSAIELLLVILAGVTSTVMAAALIAVVKMLIGLRLEVTELSGDVKRTTASLGDFKAKVWAKVDRHEGQLIELNSNNKRSA